MRLNKGFCFLVLFLNIHALAQDEKQPLRTILQTLEQRYDVSFTFLDENIEGVFIQNPPEKLSLTEVLQFLQHYTSLDFNQLDQRFITISKPVAKRVDACGFLIDSLNDERIPGAVIRGGDKVTTSDHEGYFQLPGIAMESKVSIQLLGYKTISLSAGTLAGSPCKTIVFSADPKLLQEIVITNYLTEGIDKKTDGSFVMHTQSLGILPGLTEPDVLHTIQSLPGILSVDETVSNINVRGGTHDQNLILWDGIKMYQPGHFFGLISAFNPYLTRDVNLIKNGTTAALNDGVSSTIDVHSDDFIVQGVSGGGGINLINGDLFLKIPVSKKSSLQVSSRRSLADIAQTPTYSEYYERAFRDTDAIPGNNSVTTTDEKFYFYDFGMKLLSNPTVRDKLRLNFLNINNNIQYQENALVNNRTESKTSHLTQHNLAAGISYSRLWSDRVQTSGQLYLSLYDLEAVNYDIINDQRLNQQNDVLDTGIKIDTRIGLSDRIDLLCGYQFFEVGVGNLEDINNPPFYRSIKKVLRTQVVFTEFEFTSPSHAMSLRAGIRGNYLTKFDRMIAEPRISFNQKFLNYFSLEILGEMKSQTTMQVIDFQNDFLGIEKRRWVLSDDAEIPISRSRQLSAGIHYQKRNFLASLEGYVKSVTGIISSGQGFQNQFQNNRSGGNYEISGIDFMVNKKMERFNSWVSYSYADNRYTFKAFTPSVFPHNLHIKHSVKIGGSYQYNHFQLSIGLNWHTGRPFTQPLDTNAITGNAINFKDPNSSRLEDYMRIDLSAKYSFSLAEKVKALAGVSFWNLSDRENIIDAYYKIDNNGGVNLVEKRSLAFTPNLVFRISF